MPVTVAAPDGAEWGYDEVKTAHKQTSLGMVPILVWKDIDKARVHYGDEGIIAILDGTSVRVAGQAIARRNKVAGKTDDEIATLLVAYRPGKRVVGASTPVSRARKAAEQAAEKIDPDLLTSILEKIANGTITAAEAAAFAG